MASSAAKKHETRLVLLIGATGEGKSTAASYLLNPDTAIASPAFKRAAGMRPQTTQTQVETLVWKPKDDGKNSRMQSITGAFSKVKIAPEGESKQASAESSSFPLQLKKTGGESPRTQQKAQPSGSPDSKVFEVVKMFEKKAEESAAADKSPPRSPRTPRTPRQSVNVDVGKPSTSLEKKMMPVVEQEVYLKIADSPGLGENDIADTQHMINVFKLLREVDNISAIILCMRMSSKINQRLQQLLRYYRQILGPIVETNFFVVMTQVGMDTESRKLREYDGMSVEKNVEDLQVELRQVFGVPIPPTVIPFDGRPVRDGVDWARAQRDLVIMKILSLPVVSVKNLRFAKLDGMKEEDAVLKAGLKGELLGYQKRLEQTQKGIDETATQLQKTEEVLERCTKAYATASTKIDEMTQDGEVQTGNFQFIEEWGKLKWDRDRISFKIDTTPVLINRVAITTQHDTFVENYKETPYTVSGEACGGWILGITRRLYINVTTYAEKKVYNQAAINEQHAVKAKAEADIARAEKEKRAILTKESAYRVSLAQLDEEIVRIRPMIAKLDSDYLDSLEEAIERHAQMLAKSKAN